MVNRIFKLAPVAALLAMASVGAQATGASAKLTISQDDTSASWTLDLSSLLSTDASGNATLSLGLASSSPATVSTTSSDAGAWEVLNGTTLQWHTNATVNPDAAWNKDTNPWLSAVNFTQITSKGDPELFYGIGFRNNTTSTQTYTYTQGETMDTPINGPYNIHADISGSLTNSTANPNAVLTPFGLNTQILSLGNGGVISTAGGVDVGPTVTNSGSPAGSVTWGPYSADNSGTGSFDYWEIQAKFKLTAKSGAGLSGYASITEVPEPGNYAMLLAGLSALTWVVRRRQGN